MPGWFDTVIISALLLGLPVALILAWAFELTPDWRQANSRRCGRRGIAPQTGRRLDYAILTGIGLVAVLFVADRIMPEKPRSSFETRRCGVRLRVVASTEDPAVIERILNHLGRRAGSPTVLYRSLRMISCLIIYRAFS